MDSQRNFCSDKYDAYIPSDKHETKFTFENGS